MADQPNPPAAAPKINIDGVEYSADSLSPNAKQHIVTIRMADREIRQLETQLMLARIARQTLATSLKNELTTPKPDAPAAPKPDAPFSTDPPALGGSLWEGGGPGLGLPQGIGFIATRS